MQHCLTCTARSPGRDRQQIAGGIPYRKQPLFLISDQVIFRGIHFLGKYIILRCHSHAAAFCPCLRCLRHGFHGHSAAACICLQRQDGLRRVLRRSFRRTKSAAHKPCLLRLINLILLGNLHLRHRPGYKLPLRLERHHVRIQIQMKNSFFIRHDLNLIHHGNKFSGFFSDQNGIIKSRGTFCLLRRQRQGIFLFIADRVFQFPILPFPSDQKRGIFRFCIKIRKCG